jgi:hypothetical protein
MRCSESFTRRCRSDLAVILKTRVKSVMRHVVFPAPLNRC